MKEQIYNDIKEVLQAMADAIGVTAEYFWPIFVRQQVIEGISGFIALSTCAAAGMWLLRKGLRIGERDGYSYIWIGGVLLVACMFFILFGLDLIVGHIFNPEYAAIRDIIDQIK